MTKAELINSIASKTGMTKADSNKALSAVFLSMKESLKNGERVSIPGFGTFHVVERKARIGHNPRTGERLNIATKKIAKFRVSKHLFEPPIDPGILVK
ncbi:MAG: HU family DNA-binding protein [Candidatus Brocadiaceae bacterium]|nr:HU family DNA-binding protein [Candidatus Brocadiaceae bacterium]